MISYLIYDATGYINYCEVIYFIDNVFLPVTIEKHLYVNNKPTYNTLNYLLNNVEMINACIF